MKCLTNKKNVLVIITFFLILYIQYKFKIKCPWINDLNIHCAGCGGTRMFISIFKLEFYQAFRYNPLLFITIIILFIYIIYSVFCKILKIRIIEINQKHLIIYLIITISFMILRNTETFSYLKPTIIK